MYQMRSKEYDVAIVNGLVFDGISTKSTDIGICKGKIAYIGKINPETALTVVDAANKYVTPGLIDFHCHVAYGSDWASVPAEVYAPASGVTTVVDAGSLGCGGFDAFAKGILSQSVLGMKAYLYLSSGGQVGLGSNEDHNPALINEDLISEVVEKYRDKIVALKLKVDKERLDAYGLEPLRLAVQIGEKVGLPVIAHASNPVAPIEDILNILRAGDIYCHVYHGKGQGILDENGKVLPCVIEARKRGVIFDAAHGKMVNFSLDVAKKAIEQGFLPDIISSDYTKYSHNARYPFTFMLSEFLHLGMSFEEIIARCTINPNKFMTGDSSPMLEVGKCADISIFEIEETEAKLWDFFGTTLDVNKLITAKMAIRQGMILFDTLSDKKLRNK